MDNVVVQTVESRAPGSQFDPSIIDELLYEL